LRLDPVLWIPAGEPPHKDAWQPSVASSRLAMVRAAASADDRFEVSAIEVERSGPSYTVDTVRALRAELGDADLFLIIGVDQYRAFDAWRNPAGILAHACLAVMDRVGESARAVHPDVLTVEQNHAVD
jgi:nicotinate-nucleotide adenylyltransferase